MDICSFGRSTEFLMKGSSHLFCLDDMGSRISFSSIHTYVITDLPALVVFTEKNKRTINVLSLARLNRFVYSIDFLNSL